MRLIELSYTTPSWELQNLQLGDVNLIVGKNTVGKSRTLFAIDSICKMIADKIDSNFWGEWSLKFQDKDETVTYKFSTSNNFIKEEIKLNNKIILNRNHQNEARLRTEISKKDETIYPPTDRLVLHVRRDVKAYPLLEKIINWAEQVNNLQFANIHPSTKIRKNNTTIDFEYITSIFSKLEKNQFDEVKKNINKVGYNVKDLELKEMKDFKILFIGETELGFHVPHFELSQGMYRALTVISYLEYLIQNEKISTLLIDDLCEGLDYEHAIKLGKLVFEKCKNSNIQLIATSNDSFLMDVVDIKYWNLLQRKGSLVTSLNYKNNPVLFEDFKFTGLSNFDFFSSDYIEQKTV